MITKYKLFENLDFNVIIENCKPFIKEMKEIFPNKEDFKALYRGYIIHYNNVDDDRYSHIKKIKTQTNRNPLTTTNKIHKISNELFQETFGWKARSEGAFATSDEYEAKRYGDVYMFMPIGEYKYIYHVEIPDFIYLLETVVEDLNLENKFNNGNYSEEDLKRIKHLLKPHIKAFSEDELKNAFLYNSEISFKCKEYYLINKYDINKLIDLIYD